jgi:hypothetical protein
MRYSRFPRPRPGLPYAHMTQMAAKRGGLAAISGKSRRSTGGDYSPE